METEIKISKASENDIRSTERFLELIEQMFSGDSVDDMPIFKKVWSELGYMPIISKEQAAVIKLEIIRRYFSACSGRWTKVISTADVMVDHICSPDTSFIELHPFLKRAASNAIMGE